MNVRSIVNDALKPLRKLNPSVVPTYKDVLHMYHGEADMLPKGDGEIILADRPHMPSLLVSKNPYILN